MPVQPLTHHDILAIVGPFTRRGRHVDLAASDRLERRLAFKPVLHEGPTAASPALHETLRLENPEPGRFKLIRTVAEPGGPQASLQAEGEEPGELLTLIDTIAPRRQFHAGPGYLIALSHRLDAAAPTAPDKPPQARLTLTRGVAKLDGLTLTMRVPALSGISADIEIVATTGHTMTLPEDLLAVLGWHWAPLERGRESWTSTLRLRATRGDHSADAERKLERTARHLAQTLAEPPGQFHQRRFAARWGVAFRRAMPLLICVGLIGGAIAVPSLNLGQDSIFRMLIFHAPPLLLMLGICMREMPRIEIPPLPRASTAQTWRDTAAR
jgi:hypothetical protein